VVFAIDRAGIVGEDGPTHQPVEIFSMLRSTPGIIDFRPADYEETIAGYQAAMVSDGPTVLLLSRGALPQLAGSNRSKARRGAYVLEEFNEVISHKSPSQGITLIGTGSEVSLCLATAKVLLESHDISSRVVSMPSWSLFLEQPLEYQAEVLGSNPRIFVEASTALGFQAFAESAVRMTSFGASGPARDVRRFFGFTVENLLKHALDRLQMVKI
jgi:transketolase